MKKKVLALSIAAMIGGVAHAGVSFAGAANATTATTLAVSPDGIGHILLVPYFSTNNGNTTLLSLVNTDTVNGKAVKVRFRSAVNSDDIFDFQVYMSPGDVWTANVSQAADGKSQLNTTDKSCTLPFSVNQSFITDRLPASADTATKAAWTREGYVEIFNMADFVDDANTGDLYTRTKHVGGVAPCLSGASAALITALQTDPANVAAAEGGLLNFRAPTTGLFGSWTVVNIQGASVAWSGNMTAIRANTGGGAAGSGRIVFSPQTAAAAANVDLLTSDPLLRTADVTEDTAVANPIITAAMFDLPDVSTPYTGVAALAANGAGSPIAQANQVSGALAVQSVVNEYLTDNTILAAATDWTFSMPTRRYGVAVNYAQSNAAKRVYTTGNLYFTAANTTIQGLSVCVAASTLTSRDREEQAPSAGFVISPGTPSTLEFCGEASVLTFNSTDVLGSSISKKNIDATYRDGWLSISTPGLAAAGLPIIGSSFVKATGPAVAGKSTNFGMTNDHRFTR
jgi:hypothetical protein